MTILSKPIPVLRQEFLEFLANQQITHFSTRNVMEWYEFRMHKLKRTFNKRAASPALHRQVIKQLLIEGKINRTSRGIYEVVNIKNGVNRKHSEIPMNDLSSIAEEKWSRLSSSSFNPDRILDKETINRIKK